MYYYGYGCGNLNSDKSDASINFVWGHVGKKLQKLDSERMLCLTQQNPDLKLSVLTNIELDDLIKEIFVDNKDIAILNKEIKKKILHINNVDNTFRETSKFLRHKEDMLSIGSAITGQIERTNLPLRTDYKNKNSEDE